LTHTRAVRIHTVIRGEKIMPFPIITELEPHFIRLTGKGKGKGKVHPRTSHEGPEVE
jgi:hypothetical protein